MTFLPTTLYRPVSSGRSTLGLTNFVPRAALLGVLIFSGAPAALPVDAANPAPQSTAAPAAKFPPTASADPLDSMTRDGSRAASAASAGSLDSGGAGESMSIGGAALRAALSLGVVLALVVGAIKYLKSRGYGITGPQTGASPVVAGAPLKPQFGISPLAQLLVSAKQPPDSVSPAAPRSRTGSGSGSGIGDFEVLGTQLLPGSGHTLYKVKVGERVLLLGGSPSGSLNVLTEWDEETRPETERRFDEMLDEMENGARAVSYRSEPQTSLAPLIHEGHQTKASLQAAASRLSAAVRRASEAQDESRFSPKDY